MTTITGQHFIAGRRSRMGEALFYSYDPRQRVRHPVAFADATSTEVDQAVQAAYAAYEQTRHYPSAKLAEFLEQVAREIEQLGDDLLTTTDAETGLGLARLTSERARTTNQLRMFAALLREGSYVEAIIDTAQPERQPLPRPSIRRMLHPIGPVAVFSASNFPYAFAVAGGDTASAWAAGCPVIVKGHPSHPMTSELVATAVERAVAACDFPSGFFSLLQGASIEVGQALVKHPRMAAVGFTGSLRGGRALFDAAAARPVPIPVYAEMGSVNPVVLSPGALRARAEALAEGLAHSATLGAGQFCTNPGLVFLIASPEAEAFVELYVRTMEAAAPGVLLNEAILTNLTRMVGTTTSKAGVALMTGGRPMDGRGCGYAHTVMRVHAADFCADESLQEEHFGPVTLIVVCESESELITALKTLHGNLTGTVHAQNDELEFARRVYDVLRERVGRLIWNGFPTGVEVCHAMQHGGPYPATTAPHTTSVGMTAIKRFMRPVAYQGLPDALLPDALKDHNPLGIWRIVDGQYCR